MSHDPLELIAQAHREEPGRMSLERLLTSSAGFGLTNASPLQRAICRAAEGRALGELDTPAIRARMSAIPGGEPKEVLIRAAIRSAKSMMAGAQAVKAAQTCDVSGLGAGEVPRVSVVSTKMDNADVVMGHIVGNLQAKPSLRRLLIGEPSGDSAFLRHPSGRPVEIRVVAGARAGNTLVSRWSAGVIFDEAPRMVGSDEGVVNLDDCRSAVLGRLLRGAQIWYIGSPWAPFGPFWELEHAPPPGMLCVHGPGWEMWPAHWTPERCAELKASDPDAFRTDVEAEYADPETALLSSVDIIACERAELAHVPPEYGHEYFAAMDPATRGNAWTLVIVTRARSGKLQVVWNQQWIGSKTQPLKPKTVLQEMARVCVRYRCSEVWSDGWSVDALANIGEDVGLEILARPSDAATKWNRYRSFATRLEDRQVELPPDPVLRADLLGIRKRVTQTGTSIVLPQTSNGRHCDYAPALVLALSRYLDDPAQARPEAGTREAWELAEREDEERDEADERRRERGPFGHDDGWDIGA